MQLGPVTIQDAGLDGVVARLRELDPDGSRIGRVLRQTLDQLYDGQHTGRYRWDQLHKTEKTHCGTLVEINLHREFGFDDGLEMDFRIADVDIDCKYSQTLGGWMIPPESKGHLCMLLWADDQRAAWSLGIVRIEDAILNQGNNRDGKRTISAQGREAIHWIFRDVPLPPNVLLQLPRPTVDAIIALPNGQRRIDEIFRRAQGQRISRAVVATLGQQDDFMKRVRGNGGSRTRLRPEGILVLGDYDQHRRIAQELGVAIPQRGEFVSIRVAIAAAAGPDVTILDDRCWKVAADSDVVTEAPECPHSSRMP